MSIPNFDVYGATSLYTTVGDLLKWQHYRDHCAPGYTDHDWKIYQTPTTPEAMHKMLKYWSGIKREMNLLQQNNYWSEADLDEMIKHWGDSALPEFQPIVEGLKSSFLRTQERGFINVFPTREDHKLPMLVALHQLGLEDALSQLITENNAEWKTFTTTHRGFALSLQKTYPALMQRLSLSPEHWAELRRKFSRDFHQAQVLLAQTQLRNNKIDDLNSPWLVDPDAE